MVRELQQWVDLHIKHEIPPTLLIMSRAFTSGGKPQLENEAPQIPDEQEHIKALQNALGTLPPDVVSATAMNLQEGTGMKADYEQKLEAIKKQEQLIALELSQEKVGTHGSREISLISHRLTTRTILPVPKQPLKRQKSMSTERLQYWMLRQERKSLRRKSKMTKKFRDYPMPLQMSLACRPLRKLTRLW